MCSWVPQLTSFAIRSPTSRVPMPILPAARLLNGGRGKSEDRSSRAPQDSEPEQRSPRRFLRILSPHRIDLRVFARESAQEPWRAIGHADCWPIQDMKIQMCRMSTGVAALIMAGLVGCGGQPALTSDEGSGGNSAGASGGQAGSTGISSGFGGTTGAGGVGAGKTGGAGGGTGGASGCPLIACPALACVGETQPNPDPCGCPICAPTPDAGVAKDAGGQDTRICLALPCAPPLCPGGYVTDPDPCGCPICAPTPDAGVAKDADGADARRICPLIACPGIACLGGYVPNPDPCGCPLCGPAPDAGAAKDATPPTACPMLASLNSPDATQVGYTAARALVNCTYADGVRSTCVSNNPTSCSDSGLLVPDSAVCSNLCTADQYGLAYGEAGPLGPPASIDLPAGCGAGMYTPGGVAFYCCPCGM